MADDDESCLEQLPALCPCVGRERPGEAKDVEYLLLSQEGDVVEMQQADEAAIARATDLATAHAETVAQWLVAADSGFYGETVHEESPNVDPDWLRRSFVHAVSSESTPSPPGLGAPSPNLSRCAPIHGGKQKLKIEAEVALLTAISVDTVSPRDQCTAPDEPTARLIPTVPGFGSRARAMPKELSEQPTPARAMPREHEPPQFVPGAVPLVTPLSVATVSAKMSLMGPSPLVLSARCTPLQLGRRSRSVGYIEMITPASMDTLLPSTRGFGSKTRATPLSEGAVHRVPLLTPLSVETVRAKAGLSRRCTPSQRMGGCWSAGDIAMLTPLSVDTVRVLSECRAPDEPVVRSVRRFGAKVRSKPVELSSESLSGGHVDMAPLVTPMTSDISTKYSLLSLMGFSAESGWGEVPATVPPITPSSVDTARAREIRQLESEEDWSSWWNQGPAQWLSSSASAPKDSGAEAVLLSPRPCLASLLPRAADASSPGGASDESEAPGVVARLFSGDKESS